MLSMLKTALVKFLNPILSNLVFFCLIVLLSCGLDLYSITVLQLRAFRNTADALSQGVLFGYAFCLVFSAIKNAKAQLILKSSILLVYWVWIILEIGCLSMTGVPLDLGTTLLIGETNFNEAIGFFQQYFSWQIPLIIIVFILIIVVLALLAAKFIQYISRYVVALVFGAMLVNGIMNLVSFIPFFGVKSYSELLVWISTPRDNKRDKFYWLTYSSMPLKATFFMMSNEFQNEGIEYWEDVQERALTSECYANSDLDFDIAVIVGESFIRKHSSLYGYTLQTNPRLEEEARTGNLVVFSNMMTVHNFTMISLRNAFSLNDVSSGEQWYTGVYYPLLIKKAGWHVYHYDNQTVDLLKDHALSSLFYSPIVTENVLDGKSIRTFATDREYLDYLDRDAYPQEKTGNKFTIYHLAGQHFPYSSKFENQVHFTASDIRTGLNLTEKQRKEVADYDNAVLYNDSIVGQIFRHLSERPTVAFYFSDHGEDIWDLGSMEARNKPQPSNPEWIDRQFHIPFFVWMSDEFLERYPNKVQRIRNAKDVPATIDVVGYAILGLAGIDTPYYQPARDFMDSLYVRKTRYTVDGYPLD